MSNLRIATLRDGSQVPMPTVLATAQNFKDLYRESPHAFHELIALCKDSNHKITDIHTPDYAKTILTERRLIDLRGKVHDDAAVPAG